MKKQYMKLLFSIITLGILSGCSNSESELTYSTDGSSLDFRGDTYNIIEYGGHYWLDRNLGASSVCQNYQGDPECWGDLYQWGRPADGHQERDSSIRSEISNDAQPRHGDFIHVHIAEKDVIKAAPQMANANWYIAHDNSFWQAGDVASNEVCPDGWRLPTVEDFQALNIINAADAFNKIKLTLGGFRPGHDRSNDGQAKGASYDGYYWTSTLETNTKAVALTLDTTNGPFYNRKPKASGHSVRCMKD